MFGKKDKPDTEGLREMLSDLKEKLEPKPYIDDRNQESVYDALIESMAISRRISGEQLIPEGIMTIMKEIYKSTEFKIALETIARKVLEIFPVQAPSDREE